MENKYYLSWRIGVQIFEERDDKKPMSYLNNFAYLTTLSVTHAT
jgi:hypothetical protein